MNFLSDDEIIDGVTSELSEVQTLDMRISDSPWSIKDDVCYILKTPPTGILNIKVSDLQHINTKSPNSNT